MMWYRVDRILRIVAILMSFEISISSHTYANITIPPRLTLHIYNVTPVSNERACSYPLMKAMRAVCSINLRKSFLSILIALRQTLSKPNYLYEHCIAKPLNTLPNKDNTYGSMLKWLEDYNYK